jgi:rubredoxin
VIYIRERDCGMNDSDNLWIVIDKQLKNSEIFRESTHLHRCENCGLIYSHSSFNSKGKLCSIRSDKGICPKCTIKTGGK